MTTPEPPDQPTARARGAVTLDVAPRRAGKTHRALAWVAADTDNRMLVVATVADRDHARAMARATWPDVRWRSANIFTAGQARAALSSRSPVGVQVWVDQAEHVLRQLLYAPGLAGASWTEPGSLTREPATDAP